MTCIVCKTSRPFLQMVCFLIGKMNKDYREGDFQINFLKTTNFTFNSKSRSVRLIKFLKLIKSLKQINAYSTIVENLNKHRKLNQKINRIHRRNVFLAAYFSQRLSHNVFLNNVFFTTSFSQRLFHNVLQCFLTTSSQRSRHHIMIYALSFSKSQNHHFSKIHKNKLR